jgi:hypothetical protein
MPAGEAANNTHFIVVGLIRDGSKSLKVKEMSRQTITQQK